MNDFSIRTEFKSQKYHPSFKFESDSKIYFPISTQQNEKYIENILYRLSNINSPFKHENNQNVKNIEEEKNNCKNSFDYRFYSKIPKPNKNNIINYDKYSNFETKIPKLKIDHFK